MNRGVVGLIAVAAVVIAGSLALFVRTVTAAPEVVADCTNTHQQQFEFSTQPAEFWKCREELAGIFLERDYKESKELATSFLTLLTAVLVASITFSEKIVDFSRSDGWSKAAMISCWVLLLIAIVNCGAGLALMSIAAGQAAYLPQTQFHHLEAPAVMLFVGSGGSFGSALVALIAAALLSVFDKRSAKQVVPEVGIAPETEAAGRRLETDAH